MENALYYIVTFFSGSGLTVIISGIKNRIQTLKCHYIDDEVLSKLPIVTGDGNTHENIHCKKFKLRNTTNLDIDEIKVIFQFDACSEIIESYCHCKAGYNYHKMKKGKTKNECQITVKNFNRKDIIEFTFRVGNIRENEYYITEYDSKGLRIKCSDNRKAHKKSDSHLSNKIITNVPPISGLESD